MHITGVDKRPRSEVPTASSIYSQPSPEINNATPTNDHPPRSSSLYPEDVSPPGSPPFNDGGKFGNGRESPDVSPISDTSSRSALPRSPVSTVGKFNSNLPVPKKTRKFWNRPSVGSPEEGASTTHWDVYSGEPTTSEKGKPPSTTPSAVKLHADPSPSRYGTLTHISAGTPGSGNAIGRKRVASRDPNNAPIIRPEWKGAGGRQKIVNPLLDKPLPPGTSPSFPAGSEKHQHEQRERERAAQEWSKSPTTRRSSTTRKASQAVQPSQPSTALGGQELAHHMTISPGHREEDSPSDRKSPPPYHKDQSPIPSITTENTRPPLARTPSNEKTKGRRSQALPSLPPSNPTQSDHPLVQSMGGDDDDDRLQPAPHALPKATSEEHDRNQIETKFRADLQHMHLQEEPRSHFSATTYATTANDSPPATPEIGSNSPSMSTTPDSILNRKRPVAPAGLTNARVAARKPTPSETNLRTQASPLPPSLESKRKSLPKSPPEVNAVSRVAALQAKLENLKRRKGNLQTVIHELTHVVQPSSIAYDMASRQEIKRTVEGLNKELADVIKDEHETGLKLHRAIKRDDEFAAYEPTSIWVRRVTS